MGAGLIARTSAVAVRGRADQPACHYRQSVDSRKGRIGQDAVLPSAAVAELADQLQYMPQRGHRRRGLAGDLHRPRLGQGTEKQSDCFERRLQPGAVLGWPRQGPAGAGKRARASGR